MFFYFWDLKQFNTSNNKMRKNQKRSDLQKNVNYKNLIAQYYSKDPQLGDSIEKLKPSFPQIQILDVLNNFQKKLDGLIKTKRYDVQEMFIKPAQKLKRVLRVYFVYEKKQTQDILKIYGHLYPNKQQQGALYGVPKFSAFFKQISFSIVGESQPFKTWKKPTVGFIEQDGFLLRLPKSNQQSGISIKFNLINNPPKFQVQSSLQRIVGLKKGTRIAILDAFWQYVKQNKLQDVQNKQIINCDEKLKNTFKIDKFAFATVNNRVRQLLTPIQPVNIIVKPSDEQKVFDFIVQVEQRPDVDILPFFAQKLNQEKTDHPYLSINGKIKRYQKKFHDHSQKLRRHLAKKQIYQNFSPACIEQIINQQNELLKILRKQKQNEDHNKLQFILENEQEVEKQIKHYYQQLNTGNLYPS